jgi:IS1 family transposase
MTSWWRFPPQTREVQFDEKWSFVGKKQKNCDPADPADAEQGNNWDHVAFDPEHRLVVSVVPGKRTAEKVEQLVQDFQQRTGSRAMNLMTSDEYPAYKKAILKVYGEEVRPPRTGKAGRPQAAYKVAPPALKYATVHKTRKKGRVVKVSIKVIFGTIVVVMAALAQSLVSKAINTSFIERQHGTDRNRNARKARRSYCFSKKWEVHEALTYLTMYSYNFCWAVRTLREKDGEGRWQQRTPAMAAGLTDHIWRLSEWLTYPAVQRK